MKKPTASGVKVSPACNAVKLQPDLQVERQGEEVARIRGVEDQDQREADHEGAVAEEAQVEQRRATTTQ